MSKLTSVFLPTNEYLGVLWTLAGVKDVAVINHGTGGCNFFEFATASKMTKQLIYDRYCSTGMEQEDIALSGGEDKLKAVIKEMVAKDKFSLIVIVSNPVSSLIGVDIEAVAKEVEDEIDVPIITFDHVVWNEGAEKGIEKVFCKLVEHFCPKDADVKENSGDQFSVNIIGPTVQTFNWKADEKELKRLLSSMGIDINTILTYETTTDAIKQMPKANLNIVTCTAGLKVAEYFKEHFHIPYLYGLPYGLHGTLRWIEELQKFSKRTMPTEIIKKEMAFLLHDYIEKVSSGFFYQKYWSVAIAAPPVMAKGLIRMVQDDWKLPIKAVRLTIKPNEQELEEIQSLGAQVYVTPCELEWRKVLKEADPFILMGSVEDELLSKEVPIHIRIIEPAYDTLRFHDGQPFVGWSGFQSMTQQLLNEIIKTSF